MNFVIGDIHGEIEKLKSLLTNILSVDINPKFIFIGDYLDKGADPYSTLFYLSKFSETNDCIFLRGNHEFYWEQLESDDDTYGTYLKKYGGQNTVVSVNKAFTMFETKKVLTTEFADFFKGLKNYHVEAGFVITHSGIPPELYNTKLEYIEVDRLLFNRYDFIKTEHLYLGRKVIFGHTGFYYPYYDGYKIGIDTAACYLESQPLTAFCIEENFFIDSGNNKTKLSGLDRNSCPVIPRIKAWRQL